MWLSYLHLQQIWRKSGVTTIFHVLKWPMWWEVQCNFLCRLARPFWNLVATEVKGQIFKGSISCLHHNICTNQLLHMDFLCTYIQAELQSVLVGEEQCMCVHKMLQAGTLQTVHNCLIQQLTVQFLGAIKPYMLSKNQTSKIRKLKLWK